MREQLESLQQQKKEGSDSQQQLGSAPKRKLKNFAFKTTSTNSASSNAPSSSQSHLAGFPSGDGEDPRLKKYREQYKQKLDEQKTSSGPATPLSSYSKVLLCSYMLGSTKALHFSKSPHPVPAAQLHGLEVG